MNRFVSLTLGALMACTGRTGFELLPGVARGDSNLGDAQSSASNDDSAAAWGGTNNHPGQTIQFIDQAGGDLHLAAGDTGAAELGADLSTADGLPLTDDIDQQTRPRGTHWDIGADER